MDQQADGKDCTYSESGDDGAKKQNHGTTLIVDGDPVVFVNEHKFLENHQETAHVFTRVACET